MVALNTTTSKGLKSKEAVQQSKAISEMVINSNTLRVAIHHLSQEFQEGSVNEEMLQTVDLYAQDNRFDGENWEQICANEQQEHNGAYCKWRKMWRY